MAEIRETGNLSRLEYTWTYIFPWQKLECRIFWANTVHVDGVMVARTLVDLQKSTVLNVTLEQRASAEELPWLVVSQSLVLQCGDYQNQQVRLVSWGWPLQGSLLLIWSCYAFVVQRNSQSQRERACQPLCKCSNLFSSGPGDLGSSPAWDPNWRCKANSTTTHHSKK